MKINLEMTEAEARLLRDALSEQSRQLMREAFKYQGAAFSLLRRKSNELSSLSKRVRDIEDLI